MNLKVELEQWNKRRTELRQLEDECSRLKTHVDNLELRISREVRKKHPPTGSIDWVELRVGEQLLRFGQNGITRIKQATRIDAENTIIDP